MRIPTATIVLSVLIASFAPRADAQIINTLRGFDREKSGWSGEAELTFALADGNTEYVELAAATSLQHMSKRNRWRLMGRYMDRTADGRDIAEDSMGHLRHNYRFLPWLASVAFTQVQHNPFQRLETRFLAGGGARFDIVRRERIDVAVGATYMLEREELTDDDSGFTTDNRFSFFVNAVTRGESNMSLDVIAFFQPLVDDFDDARAFASATARFDIRGGLYFLTSYSLLRDSNPPDGVEETDQAVRSGVGVEF